MHRRLTALLVLSLAAVAAAEQPPASRTYTVAEAESVVAYTQIDICKNNVGTLLCRWFNDCGLWYLEDGLERSAVGGGIPTGIWSGGGSNIDNLRAAHHHTAMDFRPAGKSDCGPCGTPAPVAGDLPRLHIERIHRYRDEHYTGSFGPGAFSNFDIMLKLERKIAPKKSSMRVFDPRNRIEHYTVADAVSSNIYHNKRNNAFKEVVLLTSGGQPANEQEDAATAELTTHDGHVYTFEIIRPVDDTVPDFNNEPPDFTWVQWGRLVKIEDRNGNGYDIAYNFVYNASTAALGGDRTKLWQIDTVTDAYGEVATFTYGGTTYPDRHAVTKITVPVGSGTEDIDYSYNLGGFNGLTGVSHPDGTSTTITGAVDSFTQCFVVEFDDAAAFEAHRRKDVYLTEAQWDDPATPAVDPVSQVPNLVRLVLNGEGEVSYLLTQNDDAGGVSGQQAWVYEGGGRQMRYVTTGGYPLRTEYASDWSHGSQDNPTINTWEPTEKYSHRTDRHITSVTDGLGRKTKWALTAKSAASTKTTFPDNTFYEADYNGFKQPLFVKDRLGRRTNYQYDGNGNLRFMTAGLKADGSDPDDPSEKGVWEYLYNSDGQVTEARDANYVSGSDEHVTRYFYSSTGNPASIDGSGYLVKIEHPKDDDADTVTPRTLYEYDASGRLFKTTDPEDRETTFEYDNRNRLVKVTYADTSTEVWDYFEPGETGYQAKFANLLRSYKDRNDNLTTYDYDDAGRVVTMTVAEGSSAPAVTDFEYLDGTTQVHMRTTLGETTEYAFDYRRRVLGVTKKPNALPNSALESLVVYDEDVHRVLARRDPYLRFTYFVYDELDHVTRTVRETVPGVIEATFSDFPTQAQLDGLTRGTGTNATYLIQDVEYNDDRDVIEVTDPNGHVTKLDYDQQARHFETITAFGSNAEAKAVKKYDGQGNVIEIENPRHHDPNENGAPFITEIDYGGRNLVEKRRVAVGVTGIEAEDSRTYFADGRSKDLTDFLGEVWSSSWGVCCGRWQAGSAPGADVDGDPALERATVTRRTDFAGNTTHTTVLRDVGDANLPTGPGQYQDANDAGTVNEVTSTYDGRHRLTSRTVWRVPLGEVNPDAPPKGVDDLSYRDAVLLLGAEGYWRLDEPSGTLADDETLNYPGEYKPNTGGAWTGGTLGEDGALPNSNNDAAAFNGTDGEVEVGDVLDFELDEPWSVTLWVKPDAVTQDFQLLVGKQDLSLATRPGWAVARYQGGFTAYVRTDGAADSLALVGTDNDLPAGAWSFITATYDGSGDASGFRTFINGEEVAHSDVYDQVNGGTSLNAGDLSIGSRDDGSGGIDSPFDGTLDEVAVFDRVLAPVEIAAMYRTADGLPAPLAVDQTGLHDGSYLPANPDGTWAGGTQQVAGALGGDSDTAATFDGDTGGVLVEGTDELDFESDEPWSVAGWIKPDPTTDTFQVIAGKQDLSLSTRPGWGVGRYQGGFAPYVRTDGAAVSLALVKTDTNLPTGVWTFVVATYDGSGDASGFKTYFNGAAVTHTAAYDQINGGTALNDGDVWIGSRDDGAGGVDSPMNGSLDDLAVFDKVLTAQEVADLWAERNGDQFDEEVDSLSPVAYWRLGDGPTAPGSEGGGYGGIGGLTSGGPISLTTRIVYDDDLTDGVGIDDTYASELSELDEGGNSFFGTDADGSAAAVTNPAGETSVAVADGLGRPVLTINGDREGVSKVKYDQVAAAPGGTAPGGIGTGSLLVTEGTDAGGDQSKTYVDGAGRLIAVEDPDNETGVYTYDHNGNVKTFRDANNVGYDCVYDARDRKIEHTDTWGDTTKWTYDDNNNVTSVAYPEDPADPVQYEYDARDRLTKIIDRLGGETVYTYDDNNNTKTITDAEGKVTTYDYDPRNLRTRITYPDHTPGSSPGDPSGGYGIKAFTYDAAGRPRVNTDQLGDTVTYVFDMADRLERREYRDASNSLALADTDTFAYDNASRMIGAGSERYNNRLAFTWNDDGTLASESLTTHGQTYTVSHGYDDENNRTSCTYPNGAAVARTFNARDLLESVAYDADGTRRGTPVSIADFTYDAGWRETTRTLGNGLVRTTTYREDTTDPDPANHKYDNRIAKISVVSGGTTYHGLSASYAYDANKNLTGETFAPDNAAHVMRPFSFTADQDDEDRLIDWERGAAGGGETRDWVLTLVGDWEQFTKDPDGAGVLPADVQDRTHTDAHEIDQVDGTAAEHDAKGNMTDDAGAGGNSGGGGGGGNPREFTYDFDNQLVSVEMPDGKVHSFTYDALGRRVSQKVDTGLMGGGPYETTVYVCATHESGLGQVIAEYKSGQPASNPERHYVYGAYVDEPLVFLAPSAQSPAPTYYHRNRKYDILGLTSSGGTVVERYAYTPYGEVTFLNGLGVVQLPHASPLGNPYLFTGQRYDAAPAVHFFKGRYFDAGLGRFLHRDPMGYINGMSIYSAYFAGRFSTDPTGFDFTGLHMGGPQRIRTIESGGVTHKFFWIDGAAHRPTTIEGREVEAYFRRHGGHWDDLSDYTLSALYIKNAEENGILAPLYVTVPLPEPDEGLTNVIHLRQNHPMSKVPAEARDAIQQTAKMLEHLQAIDPSLLDMQDEMERKMLEGQNPVEAGATTVIVTAVTAVVAEKLGGRLFKKVFGKRKPKQGSHAPATPDGPVRPGDENMYGELWKKKRAHGETEPLDMDHRPSYAAQKQALESRLGRRLTPQEAAQLKANTPAVATPRLNHQQKSRTYGGRNNPQQIAEDAQDFTRARRLDDAAME